MGARRGGTVVEAERGAGHRVTVVGAVGGAVRGRAVVGAAGGANSRDTRDEQSDEEEGEAHQGASRGAAAGRCHEEEKKKERIESLVEGTKCTKKGDVVEVQAVIKGGEADTTFAGHHFHRTPHKNKQTKLNKNKTRHQLRPVLCAVSTYQCCLS